MFNAIKPYYAILVHEDQTEGDGIPTEVIDYAWTRKGAERIQKSAYAHMDKPYTKFVAVFPANWFWWWTINAGTVYTHVRYNEETGLFESKKIAWWRRERLWRALWRLASGRNRKNRDRAKIEPPNQSHPESEAAPESE